MDFLDLVASCDIYDRADGLIHQATGNWVRLEWERQENGPTGRDVERELNRLGVDICGRWFSPASEDHEFGTLSCLVRKSQARWAEYILLRKFHLVFINRPLDSRNVEWATRWGGQAVPAWQDRSRGGRRRKRKKR